MLRTELLSFLHVEKPSFLMLPPQPVRGFFYFLCLRRGQPKSCRCVSQTNELCVVSDFVKRLLNRELYRWVHDQGEDDSSGVATSGTLQMVYGEHDYLGTEKEYRERLRREAGLPEGMEEGDYEVEEEYEDYDEYDEEGDGELFDDDEEDEENRPAKTKSQLERDIEELGLADDGYNYSQHLRNKGQGLFLEVRPCACGHRKIAQWSISCVCARATMPCRTVK
jgi:hypothetical protein